MYDSSSDDDLPSFGFVATSAKSTAGCRKNTTGSHDRIVLDDSSDEDDVCTDVQRSGNTCAPWQPSHRSQTKMTSLQSHELAVLNSVQVRQVSDKESRKVLQRKQAEEKREAQLARRRDREREKADKKHQKEMSKAIKKVTKEARQENRPGERVKQMVVVLDPSLSENAQFMASLAAELQELGVNYHVSGDLYPGSVQWRRRVWERTVDESTQIIENVVEKDESEVLVTLEAQGFVGLVHYTKQVQSGALLPPGAQTLQQFIDRLQEYHPGSRITLAVEGLDVFLRSKKTRFNRKFRQTVTGSTSSTTSQLFSDVTKLDCDLVLVELQLTRSCAVRMCADGAQLAEYVITITKALAEAPFKRESPFSFHSDLGPGATKKVLKETENKVALIWKYQLMQLNNMSDHMAAAVVAAYPSPTHLLREYESCDRRGAELLLQNVMVRRGVGTVASTRRLGPVQSKRIHTLLTSTDSSLTLT